MTELQEHIQKIKEKLALLKSLDTNLSSFGVQKHKYELNPTISESEIEDFEKTYQISLPLGYREFLKQVGNGGAGPYYGLEALENSRYVDLDYRGDNFVDISQPFTLRDYWNPIIEMETEEAYNAFEEEYQEKKWVNGLLRISNFGCGVSINLVVNGEEYGNIWVDDRGNDGGIYPDPYLSKESRIDFLSWYEAWLDEYIANNSKKKKKK
jgi:SMI1 / KNR4 family (SUKH-1)